MNEYTEKFYKDGQVGSFKSARVIVPIILELIHPKSVIDVGCGIGTWLSVFNEHGIEDIMGLDGIWIEKKWLLIPQNRFIQIDLTKPITVEREFDLVISVEVGEHIPEEYAEIYADSLTRLGPVILFSAAIPYQGGMHHVNEQWPDYWVDQFRKKNYVVVDNVRKRIWENEEVEWWYAQNIMLFIRSDYLNNNLMLKKEIEKNNLEHLSIVHPKRHLLSQAIIQTKENNSPNLFTIKNIFRKLIVKIRNK